MGLFVAPANGEQTSVFFILAVTIHRSLIDQFFQPRGRDHLVSRSCHCWPSSGCTQPHEPVTCVLLSPAPNDNARWAESHRRFRNRVRQFFRVCLFRFTIYYLSILWLSNSNQLTSREATSRRLSTRSYAV